MAPETHLLASWLIAAKTTRTPRDCRLVALAGILPDADGLGLIVDLVGKAIGHPTALYINYHHFLLHGVSGALLIATVLALIAVQKGRVAVLVLLVFHLHLLCDFVGSRGPTVDDVWPIYYLGPFARDPVWAWAGQWRLDGWQNRYLSVFLMGWALALAPRLGHSVVGVFNRRADRVFVEVLRKWRRNLSDHPLARRLSRPPWRITAGAAAFATVLGLHWAFWEPGLDVRDGQNDRKRNGIWISHGWLGADAWFANNAASSARYRDPARIRELRDLLRRNHIRDVFPHLCPAEPTGRIPGRNSVQTERFLDEFSRFRVLPWVGGPNGSGVRYGDSHWVATFTNDIGNLLAAHPRLAGIHLNVEPVRSGDLEFLEFLEQVRAGLPPGKVLSVAAHPPPVRWNPGREIHWNESFFREVARRADQIVVMMYATGTRSPRLYQKRVSDWTEEVLQWSEGKPVLLGVPTHAAEDAAGHRPEVENLKHALLGIHRGLSERPFVKNYQGVAIYAEWDTDESEWEYWRQHFLKQ